MFGLIWFVQIVHYPLFGLVGVSGFPTYQAAHQSRTTFVVFPLMLVEFVTSVVIAWSVLAAGAGRPVDIAMAVTGVALVDQARAAELLLEAIALCRKILRPEGAFLAKMFQGEAFDEVLGALKAAFQTVAVRKPAASRGESRETYLLARGLKRG